MPELNNTQDLNDIAGGLVASAVKLDYSALGVKVHIGKQD